MHIGPFFIALARSACSRRLPTVLAITMPAMITLYGIPNCDTVKRARAWMDQQGLACTFHDFKKLGVPAERLAAWCQAAGWERVLNRQGNTWRKLTPEQQAAVVDVASAQQLMLAQASSIKRPVVEWSDGTITVGFSAEAWGHRR
jgi:Spx/MgsR family transcriptional regulator